MPSLLLFAYILLLASTSRAEGLGCPTTPDPHFTTPIAQFALPTIFPNPPLHASPQDVLAIRNTLALYPLAVDGKNFAAFSEIFTWDVYTNYSAPLNVLTPLSVLEATFEASLAPVTTQHQYGTQLIDLLYSDLAPRSESECEGPTRAFSVSYFTATHFGKGVYEGQLFVAYGQYQDSWVKNVSAGTWRIAVRNLVYMVSVILTSTVIKGTASRRGTDERVCALHRLTNLRRVRTLETSQSSNRSNIISAAYGQ